MVNSCAKDDVTEEIRQLIRASIASASENDDADALLNALSYQSLRYPQRHVWIEVEPKNITLDLEDWDSADTWDNTVIEVSIESKTTAIEIMQAWLTGTTMAHLYVNGNQRDPRKQPERELIQ